ncbi:MAG: helix-turn-helix transcriptional regulator [Ferruginibacter sp.]
MKKRKEPSGYNRLKVGANIRKWRNIKEIKQKELATALRLSEAAISNIENDLTDVTLSQLENISYTLDIPVENLLADPQETLYSMNHPLTQNLKTGNGSEKEMWTALLASMQKKDEQLQLILQNVLNTLAALVQDEKKFA